MSNWYYLNGEEWIGPFNEIKMRALFVTNVINRDTVVINKNDDNGEPLCKALPSVSGDFAEFTPHPWRRYFARGLDHSIYFCISLIPTLFLESVLELSFSIMITVACLDAFLFCPIINALIIGYSGSSIGKAILGIKILDSNYNVIGFKRAFKREWMVLIRGFGLCLPSISWITNAISYYSLYKYGITSWDRDLNLKVLYKPDGMKQDLAMTFVIIINIVFVGILFGIIYTWAKSNS